MMKRVGWSIFAAGVLGDAPPGVIQVDGPSRWEQFAQCQTGTSIDAAYSGIEGNGDPLVCYLGVSWESDGEVDVWYVRHGESLWNAKDSFSRVATTAEDLGRLAGNFLKRKFGGESAPDSEQGAENSQVIDSPLSPEGIRQAEGLASKLYDLRNQPENDPMSCPSATAFATSNMRRAAMTLLVAFGETLLVGREDILKKDVQSKIATVDVLSALQESSLGPDAISLAESGQRPRLNPDNPSCPFKPQQLTDLFDSECNLGSTRIGKEKIPQVCGWLTRKHFLSAKRFVLVGHSMWLNEFFQTLQEPIQSPLGVMSVDNLATEKFRSSRAAMLETCPLSKPTNLEPSGIDESAELERRLRNGEKLSNAGMIRFKVKLSKDGTCQLVPGSTKLLHGFLREH